MNKEKAILHIQISKQKCSAAGSCNKLHALPRSCRSFALTYLLKPRASLLRRNFYLKDPTPLRALITGAARQGALNTTGGKFLSPLGQAS